MRNSSTEDDVEALIGQAEEAAGAYVRGEMERYLELVRHADVFTLLPPHGGPANRHRHRDQAVRASADLIRGGEARLTQVGAHAWGDTVVVAMIENQHGQLAGRPDQDLSLRVTHVYRCEQHEWKLVHRHADPLVSSMSLDELATLMSR